MKNTFKDTLRRMTALFLAMLMMYSCGFSSLGASAAYTYGGGTSTQAETPSVQMAVPGVSPDSHTKLVVGDTLTLNGSGTRSHNWSKGNSNAITLSSSGETGTVKANSVNSQKIQITHNYKSGAVSSTHTEYFYIDAILPAPTLGSITELLEGDSVAPNPTSNLSGFDSVTYSVAHANVAKYENGQIVGVGEGTTTYTVTAKIGSRSYTATANVTVVPSVKANDMTMTIGDVKNPDVTTNPANADKTYTFGTQGIVSYADGKFTALAVGTTTYTVSVTRNGRTYSKTANITVLPSVSAGDVTVYEGQTKQASATSIPEDSTVNFSTGNSSIATCTNSGSVYGVSVQRTGRAQRQHPAR